MERTKIVAILGPTASGKTGLAVKLAQKYDGEVISADSMQIYKTMDIGTAKPTKEEMQGIPHHLIDVLEPSEPCSAADYAVMAHKAIADVASRGKLPILAGGTGLYINTVVSDLDFSETQKFDENLREELNRLNIAELFEILQRLDPVESQIIDKFNKVRLVRAVEVCRLTGGTMTEYKEKNIKNKSRYNSLKIGLDYVKRETLYSKINQRVTTMVDEGLVDEARNVLKNSGKTALQAIGYKELAGFLNDENSLENSLESVRQESRRYAKRQLTWFRRDKEINWFFWDMEEITENLLKKVYICVDNFLKI